MEERPSNARSRGINVNVELLLQYSTTELACFEGTMR
jgi:hypothetical protein